MVGVISRVAHLVRLLDAAELPSVNALPFPLPPKLSVPSFHGGQGFTVTPERCNPNVVVRTTPTFGAHDAQTLVRKAVAELPRSTPLPASRPRPSPDRLTPPRSATGFSQIHCLQDPNCVPAKGTSIAVTWRQHHFHIHR
ncbi:hypothetical protein ACFV8E_30965 [Streptomyces sp. NPDC059849]|uniref:hypothetical protein n=1 Tax=Streptomyces sp. NPDC059849 TaxID=3346969 RepID=UPI003656E30D